MSVLCSPEKFVSMPSIERMRMRRRRCSRPRCPACGLWRPRAAGARCSGAHCAAARFETRTSAPAPPRWQSCPEYADRPAAWPSRPGDQRAVRAVAVTGQGEAAVQRNVRMHRLIARAACGPLRPMRTAPAVWLLDGPTMTGPRISNKRMCASLDAKILLHIAVRQKRNMRYYTRPHTQNAMPILRRRGKRCKKPAASRQPVLERWISAPGSSCG